jgi:pseudo-rSAM protein
MGTKDYWFALKSYVYAEFKNGRMLLYNTQNGNRIETDYEKAISLIKQMYEPKNLGVTLLDGEMQKDVGILSFVMETLDKQMGDLSDTDKFRTKPVRLVPILNLQRDVDKIKNKDDISLLIGKDVINYLLEVNICLNDVCDRNCSRCQTYYRQMRCCTANNTGAELPFVELEKFFRQIRYSAVGRINLLGGNVLKYGNINSLYDILPSFGE